MVDEKNVCNRKFNLTNDMLLEFDKKIQNIQESIKNERDILEKEKKEQNLRDLKELQDKEDSFAELMPVEWHVYTTKDTLRNPKRFFFFTFFCSNIFKKFQSLQKWKKSKN